jgi:anaerobic magnesium-protoporphyrin IX monomethyl ester cyclase
MKIAVSFPPLEPAPGVPLLTQNRQFQWFSSPTYIYPVVPATAATLLQAQGYQVLWDDGIAAEKSYSMWLESIVSAAPDLIAIETKTPVVKRHWAIIDELKKRLPATKVVLMGDHVTALPEESMKLSAVDFVLTGGDYDFQLLGLCDFLSGKETVLPAGVWYREEDQIRDTGLFQLNHDLESLPMIDRDLTQWRLYSEKNGNFRRTPGAYVMAGRDCWHHKCTFCSWTTTFPTWRARSPERTLDEVGHLIECGVREIMDDTGTFPVGKWLHTFCEGMIKRGYNRQVTMDCNMRFAALSQDEYRLMKRAGFRLLLFGLESANPQTLKRVSKGTTVEHIVNSCKAARSAGLYPHVTIMFGYPWESYEDASNTLNLGRELLIKGHAYTVQATIVIPYPGTPLFDECKANGWLKTMDWDRYDMREPIMKTPMTDAQVKELVQGIYNVVFSLEFLARRLLSVRGWDDMRYFWRAGKKVMGHLVDFGTQNNVDD